MSTSQNQAILQYLKQGNSLTPLEALSKFSCFRLGARCWDLKQQGHNIKTEIVHKSGKYFASYSLVQEAQLAFI